MKQITIRIIKDGQTKLTIPHGLLQWEGEYPLAKQNGTFAPLISRAACAQAGLDPKAVQADFIAGRRTVRDDAVLCLHFGVNPDGNEIVDEAVESEKLQAACNQKAEAAKREKYAAQIAEAAQTGRDVQISVEKWSETRRAKEGEWGEYLFICSRVEWVTPQGEFKSKTNCINTY